MKKQFKFQRRFITLVEMMIVMFLIAMITGVIAYNYTGSLEEGKAFKTKAGIEKIKTILALESANSSVESVRDDWRNVVKRSPLVQNADELIKDGWGVEYQVQTVRSENGTEELEVISQKYNEHSNKGNKSSLFKK